MSRTRGAKIIAFPAERSHGVVGAELTKPELAARWQISERWIEERQRNDGLPVKKDSYSRLVRYDIIAAERWREDWRAQKVREQSARRST